MVKKMKLSWMCHVALWTILGMSISSTSYAQTQLGGDIDGEAPGDNSGQSVSMPDANTIAIGASGNDGNGTSSGHVRVYSWNGSAWTQKGADIDGESMSDSSGCAVSMPDANTIAVGAYANDDGGVGSGHVRIFSWNGTSWVQKGGDISGDGLGEYSGFAVSMPDENTVAISSITSDSSGINSGHVRIFRWNGSSWIKKGSGILGYATSNYFGYSVSMPDSNTVACGTWGIDGNFAAVFTWNGTVWVQKGSFLNGVYFGDDFGVSVSMPDSNTIAVGSRRHDPGSVGSDAGRAQVFAWDGTNWVQKGSDLLGEAANDWFGCSVSMPDANTIAIGANLNDGTGSNAGHVRVFEWTGAYWSQKGMDVDGEAGGDQSGSSVSMPDANTVAIGSVKNDGNGGDAGHVRVYTFPVVGVPLEFNSKHASVYPNPTSGLLNVSFAQPVSGAVVTVTNALGQIISKVTIHGSTAVISLPDAAGLYQVRIEADGKTEFHVVNKL